MHPHSTRPVHSTPSLPHSLTQPVARLICPPRQVGQQLLIHLVHLEERKRQRGANQSVRESSGTKVTRFDHALLILPRQFKLQGFLAGNRGAYLSRSAPSHSGDGQNQR
ncbi:unnamed protein product [Calypogeia fissa]